MPPACPALAARKRFRRNFSVIATADHLRRSLLPVPLTNRQLRTSNRRAQPDYGIVACSAAGNSRHWVTVYGWSTPPNVA